MPKETDEERLERTISERVAEALKKEKMDPSEKRVRDIVGEVVDERLARFFEKVEGDDGNDDDEDDGNEDKPKKPKGKGKGGLFGDLLGS